MKIQRPMAKLDINALLAQVREQTRARQCLAATLAAQNHPVRMTSIRHCALKALVGQDMSEPGRFRITRFDDRGPYSHSVFNCFETAIYDALAEGFEPDD